MQGPLILTYITSILQGNMSSQQVPSAPTKLNGGRMNLASRNDEPESPYKPRPVSSERPNAPRKQGHKQAREDIDQESDQQLPSSPFKPRRMCPSAPKKHGHYSRVATNIFIEMLFGTEDDEGWLVPSFIEDERPLTWAPYRQRRIPRFRFDTPVARKLKY